VRGDRIGLGWVGGFLDAVALRPHTWESLIEDEGAGIPLVPLFLLNGDLEAGGGPDGGVDEDEAVAEAAEMVPVSVIGIYEFWRNYRGNQNPPSSRRPRGRRRP
jgi:hypothetical protein